MDRLCRPGRQCQLPDGLYLTADTDSTAAITIGGRAVAGSPFSFKARQTTIVAIDPQAAHVFSSGQVENKGIHVTASPQADAGKNTTTIRQESITLQGRGKGRYAWTPAAGLSDPAVARPVARPLVTTTYALRVTSPEGCVDTASVTVKVQEQAQVPEQLQVPHAFSPTTTR